MEEEPPIPRSTHREQVFQFAGQRREADPAQETIQRSQWGICLGKRNRSI